MKSRKIKLPDYCCPETVRTVGGTKGCDHDYPPESQEEYDDFNVSYVEWTCSKCGMQTAFEVYE